MWATERMHSMDGNAYDGEGVVNGGDAFDEGDGSDAEHACDG